MDHIKYKKLEAEKFSWSDRDFVLAYELLQSDPLYLRIPDEIERELIDLALDTGAEFARRTLDKYDCRDPLRLARMQEIRVLFDISRNDAAGARVLSAYMPNPPTIVVYENRLRVCREQLVERNSVNRIFLSNLTNICVAHEIYHHTERRKLFFVNLAHKVPILDLKVVRIEKSLTTLSEIAANAFAMKLMDLPCLPCVIHEGIGDTRRER
jgi:hypothetical protein